MKTKRILRGWRFLMDTVIALIAAEVTAAWIGRAFHLHSNPLVVGFLAVGVVAGVYSVVYEGCEHD